MYKPLRDVGEQGLNPTVHGFVSNVDMVKPIPHARRQEPYEANGYKNEYPAASFILHPKRDIGE
jgi:hypothetical protein